MARVRVSLKLCENVLNFFVTGIKVSNPVADQLVDTIGLEAFSGIQSFAAGTCSRPEGCGLIETWNEKVGEILRQATCSVAH